VEDAIRARVKRAPMHASLALGGRARNDDREREAARNTARIARTPSGAAGSQSQETGRCLAAAQCEPRHAPEASAAPLLSPPLALREMKDTMASRFWETEDEDENE